MRSMRVNFVFFFLVFLMSPFSFADKEIIRFEGDALEQDADLPYLYPGAPVVKNRKVQLNNRLGFSGGGVYHATEAFYKLWSYSGGASYFISNSSAIRFDYLRHSEDISKLSEALQGADTPWDVTKMNRKQEDLLLSYVYSPIYGKMSLLKGFVRNLTSEIYLGAGAVRYSDGALFPSMGLGIGQTLFFNNHFGFRINLGLRAYNGPSLISHNTENPNHPDAIPESGDSGDYKTRFHTDTILNLSLIFVF